MTDPAPWSDAALGALRGDLQELRDCRAFDAALTGVVFFLALCACAVLTPNHLDPEGSLVAGIIGWVVPVLSATRFWAWRRRRRQEGYAEAVRLRAPALRASVPLLDAGQVTATQDGRLVVDGWRGGLPVALSTWVQLATPEEDELVVRVGAPPALRRPRIVTTADLAVVVAATPDSLNGWRLARPRAEELVGDLARRFGVSVAWGPDGVELRGPADHRLLRRDRVEALLAAAVGLAHACGLVAAASVRPATPTPERQPWCPYCRDAIETEPTSECSGCGTAHHAQCLAEQGRCTVFGCGRRQARLGALA